MKEIAGNEYQASATRADRFRTNYRPDIDGLRAIAVLLVVIYHCGLGFPGGFVGVDVFFVISGYLISGIIITEAQQDRFSMAAFWERRIRRIVPAATVMTVISLAAGAIFLLPQSYVEQAWAALWQQFLCANIFYWRGAGYFAGPSHYTPLLHTWSLAVEEQFYVFLPPILALLAKRMSERSVLLVLSFAATGSLLLSGLLCKHFPSATFFLLPTRAWELLLGGILWIIVRKRPSSSSLHSGIMSGAGLAMILVASLFFTKETTFPGFNALLPCAGAAAVLYAGTWPNPVTRTISAQPLVFVGLISYSLYLWHWPIFAFINNYLPSDKAAWARGSAGLCAAFVLSYISYRFVETPFRRSNISVGGVSKFASRTFFASLLVICSISAAIIAFSGFPNRVPAQAITFFDSRNDNANIRDVSAAQITRGEVHRFGQIGAVRKCLIWGDSHAMSLVAGLEKACKESSVEGIQITQTGTAPILDFHISHGIGLQDGARDYSQAVYDFAISSGAQHIVLAAYWTRYASNPEIYDRIRDTVDKLIQQGLKVGLVLDNAMQAEDVPLFLARRALHGWPVDGVGLVHSIHQERNRDFELTFERLRAIGAHTIDPARILVADGKWIMQVAGRSLYYDDDHLSTTASMMLAPLFAEFLNE